LGWYDDFGAGTYATTTSNVLNVGQIFYDKIFLEPQKQSLKLIPFGDRKPIPMAAGKTIEWNRYNDISASVSAALLSEGVNPSATLVTGQKLQATLKEYGQFAQIPSLLSQTHIDPKCSQMAGLFGEAASIILDTLTHMEVMANGAMPLRADFDVDTGATFTGAVDSATTTTVVDATLSANPDYGDANDDLNQSIITMLSGTSKGQQRAVTDYVTATGTITVSPAWDVTPVAGDTFIVTTADGIASGDKLTYENIKKARTNLKKYRAPAFQGGYYVALVGPDGASGLMDDDKWLAAQEYKDSVTGLFDGEIGKFAGVRFIEETNEFIFPITTRGTAGSSYGVGATGANYSTSGHVASVPILGRNAFGVTTFKNKQGQLPKPPIIVKESGPNDTGNPLNRYGTLGWVLEFACKGLQPLWAQQIWIYQ
jgi:N4-gp56 family major capsid protein